MASPAASTECTRDGPAEAPTAGAVLASEVGRIVQWQATSRRSGTMKSPGHQKFPDHKVAERHVADKMEVEVAGEILADSQDVIQVEEDGSPARLYFPRSAVAMEKLEASSTTTQCPFKGTARYFNLELDGKTLPDAVWSY